MHPYFTEFQIKCTRILLNFSKTHPGLGARGAEELGAEQPGDHARRGRGVLPRGAGAPRGRPAAVQGVPGEVHPDRGASLRTCTTLLREFQINAPVFYGISDKMHPYFTEFQ